MLIKQIVCFFVLISDYVAKIAIFFILLGKDKDVFLKTSVISLLYDGINLQTALFTLACTCTLVLALGSVKLVRECYAHTLMVVIFRKGGRGADEIACHCIMLLMENIIKGQGYTQSVIFQE